MGLSGVAMTDEDKVAEVFKMPDEDKARDMRWEPNLAEENREDLPWPEENESKE
jgi:hypothetical protein